MTHDQIVEVVRWSTTIGLGGVAVAFELRTKHIPNALTLGALLPLLVVAAVLDRLRDAGAGFLIAAIFGVWMFRRNLLAGGGVKTAAMLSAAGGVAVGTAMAITVVVGSAVLETLQRRDARRGTFSPGVASTPIALGVAALGLAARASWLAFG